MSSSGQSRRGKTGDSIIPIKRQKLNLKKPRKITAKRNSHTGDFLSSPPVKISPSNTGGMGSIPDCSVKISYASGPKSPKHLCNIVTNSVKT